MESRMKKMVWLSLPLILAFSLCAKAEKGDIPGSTFSPAPDFTLTDLMGNELMLSDYQGKVVFMNFWATWCPPCRAEIPGFVEAYQEYKDDGMEIIGISVDRVGKDKVLDFARAFNINYPVAIFTSKIIRDYEPGRMIPTTIIIDKNGRIRHKHIGYMDKDTLERYFLDLADEK
jgi:cytochrome c biogenesis protein CcmG/thiol:disulfide interchange protein DsbE